MNVQVLVTHATKHGATAKIAAKTGGALREANPRPAQLPPSEKKWN